VVTSMETLHYPSFKFFGTHYSLPTLPKVWNKVICSSTAVLWFSVTPGPHRTIYDCGVINQKKSNFSATMEGLETVLSCIILLVLELQESFAGTYQVIGG
jgi:hypothetical protein